MSSLYADTSALARAYLADEEDHAVLRRRLLEGDEPVVTSEFTRLELASAVLAAARNSRLGDPAPLLARIDADCRPGGPVALVRLDAAAVLPRAYDLVRAYPLGAADALHVAVALAASGPGGPAEEVVFVTRDARQGEAARAEGLSVA